jgi:uncharacterized protein (TIGR02266 family)
MAARYFFLNGIASDRLSCRFFGGFMQDKRQTGPRIVASIEISFENAGASVSSSILNLIRGGVFIKADNPLPIDSLLSLRFHLPGDPEAMDIQGRVVWIKQRSGVFPAGMGIQFMELSPSDQEKIQAFVESRMRP